MMMLQTFLCIVLHACTTEASLDQTAMLRAKLRSGRRNPPRQIATLLLGASLAKLPQSMDERVDKAFETMTKNHPHDQHIYFASGYRDPKKPNKKTEAEHIRDELQKKYRTAKLTQPKFVLDDKAQFTVDNFMKTIPLINSYIASYGNIEKCYLVTSCYHMDRAWAILEEFRNLGLANRCRFERCEAPYDFSKNGDGKFLEEMRNGQRRIDEFRDPARDRSNAEIFAKLCKREMRDPRSLNRAQVMGLCQLYAINNGVKFHRVGNFLSTYGQVDTDHIKKFNEKMDQMDKMISLFMKGHDFQKKCTLASAYKIDVSTKGEAVMDSGDSRVSQFTEDCMATMQQYVQADGCASTAA